MKNTIKIAVILAIFSNSIFAQKGNTGAVITNPATKPKMVGAIDLKAESITFSLVRRIDDNRAIIRVTGTIKNVGREKYVSEERQQGVNLSEIQSSTFPNPVGPTTVKKDQLFATLDPGATMQISYDMEWNKSNEFPPVFRLNITFDPDITMDGNTKNDDSVYANNKLDIDARLTVNAIRW
jgi:uncharacterized protein YdeI (BOF family)